MAKSDARRLIRNTSIVNSTRVYVLQARVKSEPHTHEPKLVWFVATFQPGVEEPTYTTDVEEAQTFNSLLSADSYAGYLDSINQERHHVVDVYTYGDEK